MIEDELTLAIWSLESQWIYV